MCARYEIDAPPEDLAALFALAPPPELRPRWNAAPTQLLPVVREFAQEGRRLDHLRWGLVPSWAEDLKIGACMINARAESAATKPSFRSALRRRRCLVPVTGFYEWTGEEGARTAWIFRRSAGGPFAFAGLWETWRGGDDGKAVETFTILTTEANDDVRPVHDRMPVLVAPPDFAAWLDPSGDTSTGVEPLLRPAPAGTLRRFPVGTAVNNPRFDDPSCSRPLAEGR